MAKTYLGVDNVSQKVKRIYNGVGGVAKKIRTGYIGVNGIAQKIFSSGELSYHGTATPFYAKQWPVAASVGNYAIFAFHRNITEHLACAYDTLLTTIEIHGPGSLYGAATNFGDYALFGGGLIGTSGTSEMICYNQSLTELDVDGLSVGRYELAATSVGDYALFGGGRSGNTVLDTVDIYDKSLTRLQATYFLYGAQRHSLSATTTGNYALFDGGASFKRINAFDTSLTQSEIPDATEITWYRAATNVGNYALFAGGYSSASPHPGGKVDVVYAFNKSLTKSLPTKLVEPVDFLAATTLGDYALFGGGENDNSKYINAVNAYDTSLVRTLPRGLSIARGRFAAATVGNYVLFGSGTNGEGEDYDYVVDVYTIS